MQPVPTGIPTGLTGLPAGMTGLRIFYFLNSNLNFELGLVCRFDRFTGRFDRFIGLEIFIFLNSNLNFELGPVSYQIKPEPGRTGLTVMPTVW